MRLLRLWQPKQWLPSACTLSRGCTLGKGLPEGGGGTGGLPSAFQSGIAGT